MTGEPTEPRWLYGLAGALMLGGPLGRELYFNHYPARPEAFVLPLAVGALGAALAIGARHLAGVFGSVVFGGLLFAFADLQLEPQTWTYSAVVVLCCIAIAQVLVRHRAAIVTLTLAVFYATALVRPALAAPHRQDPEPATRSDRPVLVHVVLDAQWGVGASRAARDSQTAQFLSDFYLRRGFDLYESAYSRYMETQEALQSVMSLGGPPTEDLPAAGPYAHRLSNNPYFARLKELGYTIRVHQTTFIDFCNGRTAVDSCDVWSGNSIASFGHLDGSWTIRGLSAARYFLSTRSHIFSRLFEPHVIWRRANAGTGLAALRHLASAIVQHPSPGTAWFVHVVLPHRPYHADANCRMRADRSKYLDYDLPAHPSDSLWQAALDAYAGQVRCTHQVLGALFDTIDRSVGRQQSIVIVHGDHGARMHSQAQHDDKLPLAEYSASELNAHFGTLLAIRRPSGSAAIHREPAPIQDVIAELARSGFTGPVSTDWPHYVGLMPLLKKRSQVRTLGVAEMPWAGPPD